MKTNSGANCKTMYPHTIACLICKLDCILSVYILEKKVNVITIVCALNSWKWMNNCILHKFTRTHTTSTIFFFRKTQTHLNLILGNRSGHFLFIVTLQKPIELGPFSNWLISSGLVFRHPVPAVTQVSFFLSFKIPNLLWFLRFSFVVVVITILLVIKLALLNRYKKK